MAGIKDHTPTTIYIRDDLNRIIDKKRTYGLAVTHMINYALENHFTFNLTLYIIVHRISNRFHIGFFEDQDMHDLKWHYIYSTGSGTVGDVIRKEGFSRLSLEVIGKFSNIEHLIRTSRYYHRRLSKKGEPYKSYRGDDDVEVLLKTYRQSIGKYNAKKKTTKDLRE